MYEVYGMTIIKRLNGFYNSISEIQTKADQLYKTYMKKRLSTNPRVRVMQNRNHIIIRDDKICVGGGKITIIGHVVEL